MQVADMSELLGRSCHWMPVKRRGPLGDIGVLCTIKNVRSCFGRVEVEVHPVDGFGSRWVYLDHCELL